ncbi:MAG: AbrB/MazE/SpoVT family DNA-binding domain-containing protein [Actinobacteria bacterium]|nr:AbrB/MazE/SpoVT family DNA-binding domain-containing protein [Actinomycetota bacterium]
MTHKVGPKGQVVIPKAMRNQLGLEPGDEVVFTLDRRGVHVAPARSSRSLRGAFRGLDLVGALEADRRSEPR